ncbi:unnamed protein product [Closterium sp. NIES-64]|nr:unnamed protein product [Closterium sp. NIES-64]
MGGGFRRLRLVICFFRKHLKAHHAEQSLEEIEHGKPSAMFKRDRARVILLCHALLDVRAPPMTTQVELWCGEVLCVIMWCVIMWRQGAAAGGRHGAEGQQQPCLLTLASPQLSAPPCPSAPRFSLHFMLDFVPHARDLPHPRWQRWEGRGAALHSARVGRESIGIGSSEIRPAQARRTEAGEQQATGAPGRAAGARAAGQQRRPHQRLREEAPGGGLLRREAAGGAAAVPPSGAGSLGVCAVWPGLNQDSWGREGGSTAAWQSHCSKGEYRDGLGLSRSLAMQQRQLKGPAVAASAAGGAEAVGEGREGRGHEAASLGGSSAAS